MRIAVYLEVYMYVIFIIRPSVREKIVSIDVCQRTQVYALVN